MNTYKEEDHPRNKTSGQWETKPKPTTGVTLGQVPIPVGKKRANLLRLLRDIGMDHYRIMAHATDKDVDGLWVAATSALQRKVTPPSGRHMTRSEFDVQCGNAVVVDGKLFRAAIPGVEPNRPTVVIFKITKPTDLPHFEGIAKYAARTTGSKLGDLKPLGGGLFQAQVTAAGETGKRLSSLSDLMRLYADHGTPVRTTDRQGPGTKGTQLLAPIPHCPYFEAFFNKTTDHRTPEQVI